MSFQSKYTGQEIDELLDFLKSKKNSIDLNSDLFLEPLNVDNLYLKTTGTKLSAEESKFLDSWIKSPIKLLSSNDYDGIGIARVKEYSNNHYSVTGASSASNDMSGREITLVDFSWIHLSKDSSGSWYFDDCGDAGLAQMNIILDGDDAECLTAAGTYSPFVKG